MFVTLNKCFWQSCFQNKVKDQKCKSEMESSRTDFEVLGLENQVLGLGLENWPVLGSITALFFELLKFCGALEKFFEKRFFVEIA